MKAKAIYKETGTAKPKKEPPKEEEGQTLEEIKSDIKEEIRAYSKLAKHLKAASEEIAKAAKACADCRSQAAAEAFELMREPLEKDKENYAEAANKAAEMAKQTERELKQIEEEEKQGEAE